MQAAGSEGDPWRPAITFDFISRGGPALAADFKRTGDNAAAAARGAKILQTAISDLGSKENRTAAESANLARALRLTGDAEDRAAAKALAAEIAIKRLDESMAKSSKSAGSARGGIAGLVGELTGFGAAANAASSGGSKFKLALAGLSLATGVLEPAVAALTVAVGAVAAGTVAAGIGLGGFMAVAKSQIAPVTKAMQDQAAAVKGGAAAQKTYKADLKALTPVQRELLTSLTGVKTEFKTWSDSLARPVLTPILAALKLVNPLLKDMSPFVMAAASAIGVLVGKLSAAVHSTGFQQWLAAMLPLVKPVIVDLGVAIGHIVVGIGGMLKAFAPFTTDVLGGLDKLTAKFATWGTTLSGHTGFNAMVAEFKQNWPLLRQGLGYIATTVKNILSAMAGLATGANSKALWEVANPLLALIAGPVGASGCRPGPAVRAGGDPGGPEGGRRRQPRRQGGRRRAEAPRLFQDRDVHCRRGGDADGRGHDAHRGRGDAEGRGHDDRRRRRRGEGWRRRRARPARRVRAPRAAVPRPAGAAAGVARPGPSPGRSSARSATPCPRQGTFAGKLNNMFQGLGINSLHSFTFGGVEAWVTAKFGIPVGEAIDTSLKFIQNTWNTVWANTVTGAVKDWQKVAARMACPDERPGQVVRHLQEPGRHRLGRHPARRSSTASSTS